MLAEPVRVLPVNSWGLPEFRSAQQFEASRHPIYPLQAEEIVAYAETAQVDCIAMATHGRPGLSRLLVGSVAERVLRTSPVPVLLIRPTTQHAKPVEHTAVSTAQE